MTKTEVVDKLKVEVEDLKKDLKQRKKIIATQQQLLHSGSDSYNKVKLFVPFTVNSWTIDFGSKTDLDYILMIILSWLIRRSSLRTRDSLVIKCFGC